MPAYIFKEQWALLRGLLIKSTQYVAAASLVLASIAATLIWALQGYMGADQVTTLWISLALPTRPVALEPTSGFTEGAKNSP